jgi:hypothetical protein
MFKVSMWCSNEKKVIGTVRTQARLDAVTIRSGVSDPDPERMPTPKGISDGAPMYCRKCSGLIAFKLAGGSIVQAVPGAVEVTG